MKLARSQSACRSDAIAMDCCCRQCIPFALLLSCLYNACFEGSHELRLQMLFRLFTYTWFSSLVRLTNCECVVVEASLSYACISGTLYYKLILFTGAVFFFLTDSLTWALRTTRTIYQQLTAFRYVSVYCVGCYSAKIGKGTRDG